MSASILVVDDNPANLGSLEALLKDTGAHIVKAHSGNQALLELLSRDFALILLDIQMPTMDGFETAQLIRSRDRSRHTPIIFLTAFHRNETNVLRGYSLGAVDFLFKPIVPEILRSKVIFFLEAHSKNQELRRQGELLRAAEKREHERSLAETRQKFDRALLKEEAERERKLAEVHRLRSEELERLVAERERAQSAMHRSNQRLELLADSANRLLVTSDPFQQVHELCTRISRHLNLEVFFHYELLDDGRLVLRAHAGLEADMAAHFSRIRMGEGFSGRVAAERMRAIVDDLHPLELPGPSLVHAAGLSSVACFPLLAQDRLLGILAVGTRVERTFLADEVATLQAFCDQLAVALDRSRLISELKDSDKRKDEFLAMLGHELRNPLAPIRNALEVFRKLGGEEPMLVRAVRATERQVGQMVRLVDDLLDVSRITQGKVELRRTRIALCEIVEQAVHASEALLQRREQNLVVDLPEQQVKLDADSARLAQVIGNLLANASKYSHDRSTIRLSAEVEDDSLVLRVRDNGIGLRPEMLNRIFELFVQEAPSSDRALGGLGIGLTLVRRLVEMHGGSVQAHSDGLGKGSEFLVRLPLPAPLTLVEAVKRDEPEEAKVLPLDILLVEDNADIRETMRDLLELYGHRVSEAADGLVGVEKLLAERPRLALVDIGLPGLDGYQFAERVRQTVAAADIRLVALTGYGNHDARNRALESGFDEHLVKPVSAEDLMRVLRRLAS